jgi:hypothetical protein
MTKSYIYDLPPKGIQKKSKELLQNPEKFSIQEITDLILILTRYEIDFGLAQRVCLYFINNRLGDLDKLPVIGLIHLARVYEKPLENELMIALNNIYQDPNDEFWGIVDECFDKFEIYLKIKKPKVAK